jgi:hypothetical protein
MTWPVRNKRTFWNPRIFMEDNSILERIKEFADGAKM